MPSLLLLLGGERFVSRVWPVAPAAWLSVVMPAASHAWPPPDDGRARRLADRRAGRAAAVVALRAARLSRDGAGSVSRSHSAGAGAAVVAPAGWRAGVDVTPAARVVARHARAVGGDAEIGLAESAVGARAAPALVWALKEAAVKATGRRGLGAMPEWTIGRVADGRTELSCSSSRARVAGGWLTVDDFVCAWVVAAAGAEDCASLLNHRGHRGHGGRPF